MRPIKLHITEQSILVILSDILYRVQVTLNTKNHNSTGDCMSEKARELLKIVGQTSTVEILTYLREHSTAQYRELDAFANTRTLNVRLIQLIRHGLIEHNYQRSISRKEWYTITEKGKKVLEHMEKIMEIGKE